MAATRIMGRLATDGIVLGDDLDRHIQGGVQRLRCSLRLVRPRGIQHVALRLADTPGAAAFYRDVLGMKEVPRPDPAPVPGAWLDAGGQQIHLIEDDGPIGTPHFAPTVEDLASTIASIREHGVTVYETEHLPGAGYQAFVQDPSGNVIELNQPEESS
jgi:catechol 2,3-dioxygenase-like lactoylglutathione lyase family enzyme